jgi:hydroxyethylthiazole kinase
MHIYPFLQAVRDQRPLVHHITNWVTIFDCAQIVKSFGASPVMAHAPEEAADMTGIASALVLNIGTLTTELVESMKRSAQAANRKRIPVVLDVCGAGATPYRNQKSQELLAASTIDVIKGNASEIASIAGLPAETKGVDTGLVAADLAAVARDLAARRQCIVVVTGAEDLVASADRVVRVGNGHPIMANVVGTGCMAASTLGAFVAASPDRLADAVTAGLVCYEIAAERAAQHATGPVAFKQRLFDEAFALDEQAVEPRQRVTLG